MSDSLPAADKPVVEIDSVTRRFALVVIPSSGEHRWRARLEPEPGATPLEFADPLDLLRYLTQPATPPTQPLHASPQDAARVRGLR